MEPVPRKRRLRLRYVAAGLVLLCVSAAAILYFLADDPVTRMPPKSSIPADLPPEVRKKIEDLYSPDWECRSSAARGLNGNAAAIPFLIALLGDVEGLTSRPEPEISWEYAKEFAEELLYPPEVDMRCVHVGLLAAESLACCGTQALPQTEAVLKESRNQYARANAARALSQMEDPAAFAALVPALSDPSPHVRLQAAMGFPPDEAFRVSRQNPGPPLDSPGSDSGSLPDGEGYRPAIPGLIALLKNDPSSRTRCFAAESLSGMKGCSEVVLPVVDALRDGDVRHEAAVTLGVLKDRRAVPGLIGVLGDPNPEVRLEAAHSLGLIGDPSAAPCLAPLLRDDDVQVRRYAVAALAWLARDGLADQRTVGAFILAMADYDSLVRSWAARGAGYCRDSRVIAPLTDLLATDEQEVSRCAAKALVTHGADPAILRLPTFRPSAEAVTRAVAVLRDPRTVPPLLEALKDPDPAVRACAAEALGPFKAREAFEPLLSLLDDPFPGVRAGAAQSLGALGDRRAIPSLISLLHDERITADTSEALRKLTGQDFGDNPAAWQAWWEQNKGAEPGINTISPR